ncbi:MFS transporter [Cryobacterium sp. PAMC25264]|uniref:MFS transporter n=1 Tax=Cryobacterium sp. PAMC25264 TaxID=2861288 RepID=UPI001C6365BB|nr:MFS transporter [Cryobacterium sp. PAMC25264]QYF73225.1 MFS transporter [Cryobacterium sp. PAMC25264]
MIAGYLQALRTPGALRVFLPALLGRLSFAMVTLALLYSVQTSTGSFAAAGAATGAFGLANVIASPYRARIVDRVGQRVALGAMSILFALGLGGVAWATTRPDIPVGLVVGIAAITGLFPPPLGAAMRVIRGSLTASGPQRTRAYSIDAVCEEVLFTTGPLIAAAIIALTSPATALLATGGIAVLGTLGMTGGSASRQRGARRTPAPPALRPLRQPGFALVLMALVAVGCVLGTVEVAAPAVAERAGSVQAGSVQVGWVQVDSVQVGWVQVDSVQVAGMLLAAFAAGSAIGGLLYGQRVWRASLGVRLLVTGTTISVLCAALALVSGLLAFAAVLALVGFFLAPALIAGYLTADELTAVEVRTEASSWINTAVNACAAGAAIAVGAVVDVADPQLGFLVAAVIALALLLVAAPRLARGAGRTRPPDRTAREAARSSDPH